MDFRILQINIERDTAHHAFFGSEQLLALSKTVFPPPKELYEVAYCGKATKLKPNELWRIFNRDYPKRYRGRSMSISDVIEYTLPNNEKFYLFVDDIGFTPIDFGEEYSYSRLPEYIPGTGNYDDYVKFFYCSEKGERVVTVNVDAVLNGSRQGTCSEKGIVILTLSEVLRTIFVSKREKRAGGTSQAQKSVYEIFSDIVNL